MRTALLPGTFNPPTLGHLDIIHRASKLCDRLIVALIDNPNKAAGIFSFGEKKSLLGTICAPFSNVEIIGFRGLLVDLVQQNDIDFIIRGLRTTGDFEYEEQMAVANHIMSGIETVFLLTSPEYSHISSTLIREIGSLGHRLSDFVPAEIEEVVYKKLCTTARK